MMVYHSWWKIKGLLIITMKVSIPMFYLFIHDGIVIDRMTTIYQSMTNDREWYEYGKICSVNWDLLCSCCLEKKCPLCFVHGENDGVTGKHHGMTSYLGWDKHIVFFSHFTMNSQWDDGITMDRSWWWDMDTPGPFTDRLVFCGHWAKAFSRCSRHPTPVNP